MAEMAEESFISKEAAVVWKTVIPSYLSSKVSPVFSLLGEAFELEMSVGPTLRSYFGSEEEYSISVSLRRIGNEPNITNFSAITFIQKTDSMNDGFVFKTQGCKKAIIQDCTSLLKSCTGASGSKKIPNFRINSKVTVVCVFTDLPSTTSGILNETVEVMTQTDFDRPLLVKNIHDDKLSSDRCEQGSSSLSPDLDSLSRDLGKLLEDKVVPDVNLRCGDRTIAAHKAILAARSQVFSAMFQSEMLESETGVVDIADIDVQVLEMFLKYVYSGQLSDVPDELLPSLYAAADKYAISSLKRACSERMVNNLKTENCLNFLLLANAHSDQDLKNIIFDFILNHTEILKSQEWTRFCTENPFLSIEVLQTVVQQKGL